MPGHRHHVREEEAEILPTLKKKLSAAKWAELGDEVAAAHAAVSQRSMAASNAASTASARS